MGNLPQGFRDVLDLVLATSKDGKHVDPTRGKGLLQLYRPARIVNRHTGHVTEHPRSPCVQRALDYVEPDDAWLAAAAAAAAAREPLPPLPEPLLTAFYPAQHRDVRVEWSNVYQDLARMHLANIRVRRLCGGGKAQARCKCNALRTQRDACGVRAARCMNTRPVVI